MANRLVLRYYPVDGDWSEARYNYGSFGVTLWLQPSATYYNDSNPTMGDPNYQWPLSGDLVKANPFGDYWEGNYASIVHFDTSDLTVGQYAEKEVLLFAPNSQTVQPVDDSAFPMDVIVTGLGPDPRPSWVLEEAWELDSRSTSSYAGGALEIGIYRDDAYTPLAAIWVDGSFFQAQSTAWTGAPIPTPTGNVKLEQVDGNGENGVLVATLSLGPKPSFWVNLKQAQEVGYEIPRQVFPATLVAWTDVMMGDRRKIGYEAPYGSLTPRQYTQGVGAIQVDTVTVGLLAAPNYTLTVSLRRLYPDTYEGEYYTVKKATLTVDGRPFELVFDGTDYASVAVPDEVFVDGQTHQLTWEFE
jgi:hypothetical protein